MAKVNDLLSSRFKKPADQLSKMKSLAERSSQGGLSSFSGVFQIVPLDEKEQGELELLLKSYCPKDHNIGKDLSSLSALTSEVRAITNQAAILHGERIKRAQILLKPYRDGAFSSWLLHTYGNRQTPYNFLQYYELYTSISKPLQEKVDKMPRQAIYTLATRKCSQKEKEEVIEEYKGETKKEFLSFIRKKFPLAFKDGRSSRLADKVLKGLKEIEELTAQSRFDPTPQIKKELKEVLQSIRKRL